MWYFKILDKFIFNLEKKLIQFYKIMPIRWSKIIISIIYKNSILKSLICD
jgi:hypothetical protein